MQLYTGAEALSDFRVAKLQKQLQQITSLRAQYVYFVDLGSPLTKNEDQQLKTLITYKNAFKQAGKDRLIVVTPRLGTTSPWSSKATDIAKNAGLIKVRRIERGIAYYLTPANDSLDITALTSRLHDRMTESVFDSLESASQLFGEPKPQPLTTVDISKGKSALVSANTALGLALTDEEITYLFTAYSEMQRNPTDVELMMFAQVNSEHCRHKIFNADWVIDGKKQPKSLFKMIKNTYEHHSQDILSAYSDNAAVLRGPTGGRFFADPANGIYRYIKEPIHSVIKVETHNHPTAIAPFPGAATGVGGEIRDEGATGRGAKPKMGLAGYSVSNLRIPEAVQPWENEYGKPDRIVSALDIMLEAPIGAAAFSNEFGRPNLTGFFRTYEQQVGESRWGYHKPIMIAGGLGNIRDEHVLKQKITPGAHIIVLGGPAMLIGLGGGAASSMQTGASSEDLDFASVQRANAEMERRAQEVIDACWALGPKNPIIAVHDVGAGGLSNALPELVNDSGLGATFELRNVPSAETGLSPLEIWCNEAQERYVLALKDEDLETFTRICARERCPFAVVGKATAKQELVVTDKLLGTDPIRLPMATLFGKPPKMTRTVTRVTKDLPDLELGGIDLKEAVRRVLHVPAVGSKKFLITIGDRNVGGLVVRDQMVGPWQVPVSDVAVTAAAFDTDAGEAVAMGERTPLALISAPASARMAIGETITNLLAADIKKLSDVKLSANWMAAAGFGNEDQALYETVYAVGEEFCPALGLTIPVGKDSLSMRTKWEKNSVTSPVSLIVSGFTPVTDVTKTLTPQLDISVDSSLILIDLSQGKHRLGGSALAQAYNQLGNENPDVSPEIVQDLFDAITALKEQDKILAYHDRSDGGLLTTLVEMSFASRCGMDINIEQLSGSPLQVLFSEELGAVIQVKQSDQAAVLSQLQEQLGANVYVLGKPVRSTSFVVKNGSEVVYKNTRAQLEKWWSETSYQLQKRRDNFDCADQEYRAINNEKDPGLSPVVPFKHHTQRYKNKPQVAVLREQGVNGHVEMAAAFDTAGFASYDVHLNDIIAGRVSLDDFVGLVACGGFSYGDVLGAGEGWAKTILFDPKLRLQFEHFFNRKDTFTLGVCNGCQMLSALKELIPGANHWPTFEKNTSEQFEARLVLTKVNKSPSIFFQGMDGSYLPVPVAHGEGRAQFAHGLDKQSLAGNLVPLQFVNNSQKVTEQYPFNPNGSAHGITSLTSEDGRATIMMPHPERSFMTRQLSWAPENWENYSPWLRMFQNARSWVQDQKPS